MPRTSQGYVTRHRRVVRLLIQPEGRCGIRMWTTLVHINVHDCDQGGLGAVPWYRVSYLNDQGERIREGMGLPVVDWQAIAAQGWGIDAQRTIDHVAALCLEGAREEFAAYMGVDTSSVLVLVKAPNAKNWRNAPELGGAQ